MRIEGNTHIKITYVFLCESASHLAGGILTLQGSRVFSTCIFRVAATFHNHEAHNLNHGQAGYRDH